MTTATIRSAYDLSSTCQSTLTPEEHATRKSQASPMGPALQLSLVQRVGELRVPVKLVWTDLPEDVELQAGLSADVTVVTK
jgi:hypothetical protein